MTKLLTCPFCGSPAHLSYVSGSYGYYPPRAKAGCTNCWAVAPSEPFDDVGHGHYPSKKEAEATATESWNKRSLND